MRGTTQSPERCICCTTSMVRTSKARQGSCPTRPGATNASARMISTACEGGKARRGSMAPGAALPRKLRGLFLAVAALEFLDPAGGVHDLLLAGVVRVRFRRDLDLDHRILLAVGPLHRLAALGIDRGAGEEGMVRGGVVEDHRRVERMDAWLHGVRSLKGRELYIEINPFASTRRIPRSASSPSPCR